MSVTREGREQSRPFLVPDNVILGRLIPACTGMAHCRNLEIKEGEDPECIHSTRGQFCRSHEMGNVRRLAAARISTTM